MLHYMFICTMPDLLDLRGIFWINLTFGLSDQEIILYTAVLISLILYVSSKIVMFLASSLWIQYNSVSLF